MLSSEVALWLQTPGEQQLCPGGQICFSDRPWPPRYCLMCVIRNGASAREDCFLPPLSAVAFGALSGTLPHGNAESLLPSSIRHTFLLPSGCCAVDSREVIRPIGVIDLNGLNEPGAVPPRPQNRDGCFDCSPLHDGLLRATCRSEGSSDTRLLGDVRRGGPNPPSRL